MNGNPSTSNTVPANESPNDVLAAEITNALVVGGLIKDGHKAALLAKLKAGGVSQDDWNLWIDVATAPQSPQGGTVNG